MAGERKVKLAPRLPSDGEGVYGSILASVKFKARPKQARSAVEAHGVWG